MGMEGTNVVGFGFGVEWRGDLEYGLWNNF